MSQGPIEKAQAAWELMFMDTLLDVSAASFATEPQDTTVVPPCQGEVPERMALSGKL